MIEAETWVNAMTFTDIVLLLHPLWKQWDYSQRKVVRYDHSFGDKFELRSGHGTKVAGAAAGKAIGNKYDKANGIAQGSKLHVFDMMQGSGMSITDLNKRKCFSTLTTV